MIDEDYMAQNSEGGEQSSQIIMERIEAQPNLIPTTESDVASMRLTRYIPKWGLLKAYINMHINRVHGWFMSNRFIKEIAHFFVDQDTASIQVDTLPIYDCDICELLTSNLAIVCRMTR